MGQRWRSGKKLTEPNGHFDWNHSKGRNEKKEEWLTNERVVANIIIIRDTLSELRRKKY